MGTLRSSTDHTGLYLEDYKIKLGDPAIDENGQYLWDDSIIPNGVIDESGEITVTDTPLDV